MNKVLFDGIATQGLSSIQFHGGAEYAKYILREALLKRYPFDIVLHKGLISDPPLLKLLEESATHKIYYVSSKSELYSLIERNEYKTFYSALPYKYIDYPCSAKLFGVIHGLRDVELPWDTYKYKYYKKRWLRGVAYLISHSSILQSYIKKRNISKSKRMVSVKNAFFITVSQHSKYGILNFYPFLKPDSISVFYSPFSVNEPKKSDVSKGEDYFLMVSANRFEKNIYRAIQAFDKLFSDGRLEGKRVVITGCDHQGFFRKIKNKDKFTLCPYLPSSELEELYQNAFCFVYPSLNEGFGYPPLKAMSYGVPVIASSASSIPEVCDNAACYFSSVSTDELCNRILQLVYREELRDQLVQIGRKRVEKLQETQRSEVAKMLEMIFE